MLFSKVGTEEDKYPEKQDRINILFTPVQHKDVSPSCFYSFQPWADSTGVIKTSLQLNEDLSHGEKKQA